MPATGRCGGGIWGEVEGGGAGAWLAELADAVDADDLTLVAGMSREHGGRADGRIA